MQELNEIELIKKVYEDKGKPNNEVQAFALSCLIEYKKQLSICDVSQQRELLEALTKHNFKFKEHRSVWTVRDYVDHFLASNCG